MARRRNSGAATETQSDLNRAAPGVRCRFSLTTVENCRWALAHGPDLGQR